MAYVLIEYLNSRSDPSVSIVGVFLTKEDGMERMEQLLFPLADADGGQDPVEVEEIEEEQVLSIDGDVVFQMTYGDGHQKPVFALVSSPIAVANQKKERTFPVDRWVNDPIKDTLVHIGTKEYKKSLENCPELDDGLVYSRGVLPRVDKWVRGPTSWIKVGSKAYGKMPRVVPPLKKYTFEEIQEADLGPVPTDEESDS